MSPAPTQQQTEPNESYCPTCQEVLNLSQGGPVVVAQYATTAEENEARVFAQQTLANMEAEERARKQRIREENNRVMMALQDTDDDKLYN